MTLIVGVKCRDGVVIGTDSALTLGISTQVHTIEQPLRKKIDIVQNRVIVAGTGQFGLGQRFVAQVDHYWATSANRNLPAIEIGKRLSRATLDDFAETKMGPGAYGALVALPCQKSFELIEFTSADFQPEVKTEDYWYASMGSGQAVADPLLGFMRYTFWGDSPPSRQDGVFAVTMVLTLGCQMATLGVAPPIQMAVLRKDEKGKLLAHRIGEEELLEHETNVESAIKYFRHYQSILQEPQESSRELPQAPGK